MLNYRYNLKALFDLLEQGGELDSFIGDIFRFNLICDENYGVKEILFDEHVAKESKSEYFNKISEVLRTESFKQFVLQLIDNNDLHFYELISRKFVDLIGQEKNSSFVEVISAIDLSAGQQDTIKQEIERLLQKKVYLYNTVSKNIIGGFILKFGEKMLDLSIQANLEELKMALV